MKDPASQGLLKSLTEGFLRISTFERGQEHFLPNRDSMRTHPASSSIGLTVQSQMYLTYRKSIKSAFTRKSSANAPSMSSIYAVARSSEPGYVYLPGKSEEWWRLNVTSILRRVEGKWFHAWSTWENIARPLIKKARAAKSTHPALAGLQ